MTSQPDPAYAIADTSEIISPALILFRDLMERNIARMIAIAGDPSRLRPHCKTHKMREPIGIQLNLGITKHKCATFAEAEMLAQAGVKDVLLAYNLVGPNIRRAAEFANRYPQVTLSVTGDHPGPVGELSSTMAAAGRSIDVLLDIDTGQHRTGLEVGPEAADLYGRIVKSPGLRPGGLHVYDGHQHQKNRDERAAAVLEQWRKVIAFRDDLVSRGWPVPRIVAGGTASFPIYADKAQDDASVEMSPGTCVLNDAGYGERFPDLEFPPAALLLTRVVSRPTADRVTLDLGYKAVASDPPAGSRVVFIDVPEAEQVLQNEEHLVLKTADAGRFQPGDALLAVPRHVCPTTALHRQVYVVADGRLADRWTVVARDRWLTI